MGLRTGAVVPALLLAVAIAGCDGHGPAAPTVTIHPPTPAGTSSMRGIVYDTADRPLAGAVVEVVEGPHSGERTTTNSQGEFGFTGAFDDTSRFRATKAGHHPSTEVLRPHCEPCNPHRWVYLFLEPETPPVSIVGDYDLTFVASSTCATLPSEVRTRTYRASIAAAPYRPKTAFELKVEGATFLGAYDTIAVHIAGDYVAFWLGDQHGTPSVAEQLAPNTYVAYGGHAAVIVGTPAVNTITTTFDGFVDYCERKTAMGERYSCTAAESVAGVRCASPGHQLVLTRR